MCIAHRLVRSRVVEKEKEMEISEVGRRRILENGEGDNDEREENGVEAEIEGDWSGRGNGKEESHRELKDDSVSSMNWDDPTQLYIEKHLHLHTLVPHVDAISGEKLRPILDEERARNIYDGADADNDDGGGGGADDQVRQKRRKGKQEMEKITEREVGVCLEGKKEKKKNGGTVRYRTRSQQARTRSQKEKEKEMITEKREERGERGEREMEGWIEESGRTEKEKGRKGMNSGVQGKEEEKQDKEERERRQDGKGVKDASKYNKSEKEYDYFHSPQLLSIEEAIAQVCTGLSGRDTGTIYVYIKKGGERKSHIIVRL